MSLPQGGSRLKQVAGGSLKAGGAHSLTQQEVEGFRLFSARPEWALCSVAVFILKDCLIVYRYVSTCVWCQSCSSWLDFHFVPVVLRGSPKLKAVVHVLSLAQIFRLTQGFWVV